jgi:hypothetical protein
MGYGKARAKSEIELTCEENREEREKSREQRHRKEDGRNSHVSQPRIQIRQQWRGGKGKDSDGFYKSALTFYELAFTS